MRRVIRIESIIHILCEQNNVIVFEKRITKRMKFIYLVIQCCSILCSISLSSK